MHFTLGSHLSIYKISSFSLLYNIICCALSSMIVKLPQFMKNEFYYGQVKNFLVKEIGSIINRCLTSLPNRRSEFILSVELLMAPARKWALSKKQWYRCKRPVFTVQSNLDYPNLHYPKPRLSGWGFHLNYNSTC